MSDAIDCKCEDEKLKIKVPKEALASNFLPTETEKPSNINASPKSTVRRKDAGSRDVNRRDVNREEDTK